MSVVHKTPVRRPGSALRRPGAPLPASNIKWDEHNLEENERIKSELNPTKITEPKTPYHGPLDATILEDEDDGLGPLDLDHYATNVPAASNTEAYMGTLNLLTTAANNLSHSPASPNGASKSGAFSDDEDDSGVHRHFAEARRQHYNMRDALRVARSLLQKGAGNEEDEDEEEKKKRRPS